MWGTPIAPDPQNPAAPLQVPESAPWAQAIWRGRTRWPQTMGVRPQGRLGLDMSAVLTIPQAGVGQDHSRKGVFPGKAEPRQRWEATAPPTRPGKPDFLSLPLTRFGKEGVQSPVPCVATLGWKWWDWSHGSGAEVTQGSWALGSCVRPSTTQICPLRQVSPGTVKF